MVQLIIVDDYKKMSERAKDIIVHQIDKKPETVLGLATGGTPIGTYKELIRANGENTVDFSKVSTINLDEYIGLDEEHPKSYRYFMKNELFLHINIDEANTYVPKGTCEDLDKECRRYESLIEDIGPPDLQLLGIGENGHIGFNEPGSSMESETHVVELTPSTRTANARFFNTKEEVPTHAITMGIRSIMKSERILLLASGKRKRKAIARLLEGEVDVNFPASVLMNHPNVTLILDKEAYGVEEGNDA
ncbi:glucosamine-6-phosphate deaminase [Halobacillus sp. ACCC02827]|uniref:glucosamine-6-phosphate deaminase n=1 Tax=Halobacillus sp. ACCC02827 TaxID=3052090 RepID=UPI003364FA66